MVCCAWFRSIGAISSMITELLACRGHLFDNISQHSMWHVSFIYLSVPSSSLANFIKWTCFLHHVICSTKCIYCWMISFRSPNSLCTPKVWPSELMLFHFSSSMLYTSSINTQIVVVIWFCSLCMLHMDGAWKGHQVDMNLLPSYVLMNLVSGVYDLPF
jgi:hypothetical protein